jgi:O-antigen/teichoic acid export membrane protein
LRILGALLAFGFLYHFNLLPISARQLAKDRKEWSDLMQTSIRVSAWVGIGIAFSLTVLSERLMLLIFGKNFVPAVSVFSILIWVFPIRLLADHARWSLVAAGFRRYLLFAEIVGAVVLVTSGVILIPRFASNGAAEAAVAGNLAMWVVAHRFAVRYIGPLHNLGVLFVPFLAVFVSMTLARLITGSSLLGAAISVTGYVLMAAIAGGLRGDLKRLAYAKNTLEVCS